MCVATKADLKERIKDKLDKNCLKNIGGKCKVKTMWLAKSRTDPTPDKEFTACWLCHENDALAQEIADEAKIE